MVISVWFIGVLAYLQSPAEPSSRWFGMMVVVRGSFGIQGSGVGQAANSEQNSRVLVWGQNCNVKKNGVWGAKPNIPELWLDDLP